MSSKIVAVLIRAGRGYSQVGVMFFVILRLWLWGLSGGFLRGCGPEKLKPTDTPATRRSAAGSSGPYSRRKAVRNKRARSITTCVSSDEMSFVINGRWPNITIHISSDETGFVINEKTVEGFCILSTPNFWGVTWVYAFCTIGSFVSVIPSTGYSSYHA